MKVFYRNWSEDFATPDSGMSTMSSTGSHSSFSRSPPSATSSEPTEYGNFQQVSEQLQLRSQDSMDCRNLKVGDVCILWATLCTGEKHDVCVLWASLCVGAKV